MANHDTPQTQAIASSQCIIRHSVNQWPDMTDRSTHQHRLITFILLSKFEIAFEPIGTEPHTYRVDYVKTFFMGDHYFPQLSLEGLFATVKGQTSLC